ncbi:uncharacterized protein VNE69_03361 [Vairimorpha necatrix]|uniref:Uncharacterized protein n=1 Tax=Vairimorpha necatrix TaxID=6039 RepID=A0AAX4JB95_9MICR
MNFQERLYKLRKACDVKPENIKKLIENFKPLESHFLNIEEDTETFCYIPTEPNFQLPNYFLKTNISSGCKKYMQKNIEKNDYEDVIDLTIAELELFFAEDDSINTDKPEDISEDIVNELYRDRYKSYI